MCGLPLSAISLLTRLWPNVTRRRTLSKPTLKLYICMIEHQKPKGPPQMDETFIRNIVGMKGEAGRKWLATIPERLKDYEEKWSLKVFEPFALSYNYVAPAERADGTLAVLKLSFPEDSEFPSQIEALKLFDGNAAIRLLE